MLRMKMKLCRIMLSSKRDGDDDEAILIFGEETFLLVNTLSVSGCSSLTSDKGFDGTVAKVTFVQYTMELLQEQFPLQLNTFLWKKRSPTAKPNICDIIVQVCIRFWMDSTKETQKHTQVNNFIRNSFGGSHNHMHPNLFSHRCCNFRDNDPNIKARWHHKSNWDSRSIYFGPPFYIFSFIFSEPLAKSLNLLAWPDMLRKQKNKQAWKVLGAMFVLQKVFRKSFIIKDDKEVNQDQSKRFKWTESHHSEWIRQQNFLKLFRLHLGNPRQSFRTILQLCFLVW